MREKLRSARGETLVEILCAILIGALSVALLFSTVMVSIRMDRSAKAADERLATDLRNAEGRGTEVTDTSIIPADAKVTVGNKDTAISTDVAKPTIIFYGGDNAISYALAPAPGGTP